MISRINVLLAERRMRQRELARMLGVTRQTAYRWGTDEGIRSMSLGTAERVAAVLGCRVSDLFSEEGGRG